MTSTATKLGAFLAGLLAILCVAAPDADRGTVYAGSQELARPELTPRERWEALSPEQKVQFQRRFERLQQLDDSTRTELLGRAQKVKKTEERVLKQLSSGARRKLMAEPPEERSQLIEEMVEAEMRSKGQQIEVMLPDDLRRRLAAAPNKERRRMFEEFKLQTRERISLLVVEDTGRALGYSHRDVQRFKKLPLDRRIRKALELRKQFTTEQIAASGLPSGLTREAWVELDRLPPREYFAEVMRLRDEGIFGPQPGLVRDPLSVSREDRERAHEVARNLRNNPQEHVDLAHLPSKERRQIIGSRRRDRVMKAIADAEIFDAAQIEALEALSNQEFFLRARGVVEGLRSGKAAELRGWKPERRPGAHPRERDR